MGQQMSVCVGNCFRSVVGRAEGLVSVGAHSLLMADELLGTTQVMGQTVPQHTLVGVGVPDRLV